MGRPLRVAEGGLLYHVLNRSNGGLVVFEESADYEAFLGVLAEALGRHPMRLLAYCVMPTHFHFVLWPMADGDLSRFMRWVTLTHTQRWHASRQSAGMGHVYQGRFKSFPIEADEHFLTVCRHIERNALRAGLVDRAEAWRWGSLADLAAAPKPDDARPTLSPWPIRRPERWIERVNAGLTPLEEESLRRSILRGQPFGSPEWQAATAARLGLESVFRPRGRPKTRGS